ncbi:reverse transcriptase [Cucumis melo var. makuwa]|uniref:Reverse transcriptase n=1 Tax=Cucumis melo var. makuwa TaxID=1194695 RepID=A0A5D3D4U2_CUCMM|nr:reverse transcriptase [Cucumis melo var. makuwa]
MVDSGATHNFITEAEAKRLRLSWEKDLGRMKVVNFVALPIVELVKRTVIKLRGWKGLVDFVVVKMDDFDSNEFKMISAMQLDKSLVQEEPPSAVILLGALGKLGETVPKETPPVQASYEAPILSLKKKDRNPQRYIKRRILNKLTASRKYPLSILPNLVDRSRGVKYFPMADMQPRYCRIRATKVEGLETTYVTGLRAYEFLVVPFSLIDAKGGKCCFVPRQINVLGYVVEFHQIEVEMRKITATCDRRIPKSVTELRLCLGLVNSNGQFVEGFLKRRTSSLTELLKEEDIQWGGNLECQAAFDGLKQATIEGPSYETKELGTDATCSLIRSRAQTDSLIKRSQFEIDGSRHFILPLVTDGPYVENNPLVHRVEEEWEQMANIIRACLEEASRSIEERVDQKRCPLEFEWITKFPINDATMTYGYLST